MTRKELLSSTEGPGQPYMGATTVTLIASTTAITVAPN